jgi:hypothetical protein
MSVRRQLNSLPAAGRQSRRHDPAADGQHSNNPNEWQLFSDGHFLAGPNKKRGQPNKFERSANLLTFLSLICFPASRRNLKSNVLFFSYFIYSSWIACGMNERLPPTE